MDTEQGLFIVLEGVDGSGKETQLHLLQERLKAVGYEVEAFVFPRYEETSSHFVRRYLNGEYGPAQEVSPYAASLFYALDRYEAAPAVRQALDRGRIVLSNRYVGSNMAHQGAKFATPEEQRGFFVWADSLEYHLLGIPRPNLNIFLRLPAEISFELIGRKNKRDYTTKSHDEHEADIDHLRRVVTAYDLLHQLFPKDYVAIDCTSNGELLNIPTINDKIWRIIKPLLPKHRPQPSKETTIKLGRTIKRQKDKISPRPTSSQSEIRDKAAAEAGSEVTIPNVSLLATTLLEAYGPPSLRYNAHWSSPKSSYRYHNLELPQELKKQYKDSLEKFIKLHKELGQQLKRLPDSSSKATEDSEITTILQAVTPMASLSDIQLSSTDPLLGKATARLAATGLKETDWLAQRIQAAHRGGSTPPDDGRPKAFAKTQDPEPLQQTIARLAYSKLKPTISAASEPVQLLNWWPKNEFEILADGIYPHTSLSRNEIIAEIDQWKYEQKSRALRAVANQALPFHLDKIRYQWDVICDRMTLNQLIRDRQITDLQIQPATIRYGYEVPKLVEETRLEELYLECFDLSLALFSAMQAADQESSTGYATLQGHRVRVQFASDIGFLDSGLPLDEHQGYKNLLEAMLTKIREVHPIIGASLQVHTPEMPAKKFDLNEDLAATTTKKRRSGP